MEEIYKSDSEQQTQEVASKLSSFLHKGDVVCLYGNLGTGKTVFARALIRKLSKMPDMDVPSPTYTLVQSYQTVPATVWHFDLYRIKDPSDIYELGWEDALYDGISLIEWPERLENLAPTERLDVVFSHSEENKERRLISLIPHGEWQERLKAIKE